MTTATDRVDPDIRMVWHRVDELESGHLVGISYASRGGGYPADREGRLEDVERTADGHVKLSFHDKARDRDVFVTVGETVGESMVKQSNPDTDAPPLTIGPLLRLNAYPDHDDLASGHNSDLHDAFLGKGYRSLRVAANVKWNAKRTDWLAGQTDAEDGE